MGMIFNLEEYLNCLYCLVSLSSYISKPSVRDNGQTWLSIKLTGTCNNNIKCNKKNNSGIIMNFIWYEITTDCTISIAINLALSGQNTHENVYKCLRYIEIYF